MAGPKRGSPVLMASLLWGGSILLARVIGVVREMVLGRVLGGGLEASVYLSSFVIPDFLNYLLASGALSLVFIPLFGQHLAAGDRDRGWETFSVIATALGGLLAILTPLLWLATPLITPWLNPGFGAEELALLNRLVRIMLPAQDRHALPALAPLLYTACIIAGGLLGADSLGAEGFVWGCSRTAW